MGLLLPLLLFLGALVLSCIAFTIWRLVVWVRSLRQSRATRAPALAATTGADHSKARGHTQAPAHAPAHAPTQAATQAASAAPTALAAPLAAPLAVPLAASVAAAPVATLSPTLAPAVITTTPTLASVTAAVAPVTLPAATAAPAVIASQVWKALKPGVGTNVCLATGGTLATCDATSAAQAWYLDPATGLLHNQADGACLTAADVNNSVTLSDTACSATDAKQQWASPAAGQLLLAANRGLSLDIPGGLAAAGAPMSTWFLNNSPTQVWNFV